MSSEGPYGRHGYSANPGYGGGANPGNDAGGGGYAAPSYGQSYGGAGGGSSYAAPVPQEGAYGSQYGAYGGVAEGYQVCHHGPDG